jgi:serine/threonine protein kinase
VRKALDTTSGELVAVKILDKERMVKLGIQALVKSEIGIWKELVHPHVVRLREVLASEKQIFIVLEYAGGGEVFDRVVAQGRLGEPEAREYFAQLLEALAYLHGKGVVHRDLKHVHLLSCPVWPLTVCSPSTGCWLFGVSCLCSLIFLSPRTCCCLRRGR